MSKAPKKPKPNWADIEKEVRNSDASIRDIARIYGVSEAAIRKRMKAGGWSREAEPPARPAKKTVGAITILPPGTHPEVRTTANSSEPSDLAVHGRELAARLLGELDAVTSHIGEIEEMIEAETAGDENSRRYAAMMKAVSLPIRAATLRSLAQSIETLSKGAVPEGKKAQREEAARAVSGTGSKYAVRQAPKLVVDNEKR